MVIPVCLALFDVTCLFPAVVNIGVNGASFENTNYGVPGKFIYWMLNADWICMRDITSKII